MRSKAIDNLKMLHFKFGREKHPNVPEYALPVAKYSDKTANGLTNCIVDWINMNGYQAERISSMGRPIDNTEIVTDIIGFQKKIGSITWIPGSGTKGTADISATIKGRSVKIEVKIGNDRQSQAQIEYQMSVEKAGGVYLIAKDFDSFIQDYNNMIEKW